MKAEKAPLVQLLKTARGQLDGILKMVEDDRYCIDISNQVLATISILSKVNKEIIRAHLAGCVREAFVQGNEQQDAAKIEEIMSILEKMSK